MKIKKIEIVAGPNGSGKTTFAESYLKYRDDFNVYLNPDIIASGLSPQGSQVASIQAGRVLISEVKERISKGHSFCFESTLSGMHWLKTIQEAKSQDYEIIIYFLYLKNLKQNLERIKNRVAIGGHDIPKESVKRRIPRSFKNFWQLYRPLCNDWYIFDNSQNAPKLVQNMNAFLLLKSEEKKKFEDNFLARGMV